MADQYSSADQRNSPFARERVEPTPARPEPTIAELLGGLVGDAQTLVRKEVDLAKTEVKIEVDKAKQSAMALGAGIGVAVVGGLLLSFMLVYAINELLGLSLWLSYLIVGAVFAIVGFVLLQRGAARVREIDPVPHETIDSVRKDVEWIKEQNPSDRT